jgi:hypothetical protein
MATELIPTRNKWTLYAHYLSNSNSYQTSYVKLCDVASFQDFGRMWNHTHPRLVGDTTRAVQIQGKQVTSWSYFKDGISPEWEHPSNEHGITYSLRTTMNCGDVYTLWETLVAHCTLSSHPNDLNGVQVCRKSGTVRPHEPGLLMKFDLWFTPSASHDGIVDWLARSLSNYPFTHTSRTPTR